MHIRICRYMLLGLQLAVLSACGGDDSSSKSTADKAQETAEKVAVEPKEAVDETAGEAADAAGETADNAKAASADEMDAAGEMVDDAKAAAADVMDKADEMVDEASDKAAEAADKAEAAVAGAGAGENAGPCNVAINAGDNIAYDRKAMSVPSDCDEVTVTLTHTGKLPKEAMGHNWVLAPTDALSDIGTAGMGAGLENDYVPDDDRIVANTSIVGGGESASVTFSLDKLADGVDYGFVCTFPGHWSIMKGTFTVE